MKKTLSLMLAAVMTWGSIGVVKAEENIVTIYVSPTGNDDAEGTIDAPLKTLNGAKNAVKRNNDGSKKIEVHFRGGEYRIDSTQEFTAQDSGTEKYPITYKAYENEKVEFKGSIVLDASKSKQITDKEVLSRMYTDVRNKVVELDLAEQGVTKEMLRKHTPGGTEKSLVGGEINGLICNGIPQTVSEWPNGFANYATWDFAPTSNSFHYTDTEPLRWGKANYLIIGGYNQYDFAYIRKTVTSMDMENNTITCHSNGGGFTSAQSRRWKAYNLLEEIDIPGEYYIEPDTLKLYWYPEKSIKDIKLEFTWLESAMINITQAENISFENLSFGQTKGNAVVMKQVKNIDFIGCEFKDVGRQGIYAYSDLKAETDKDYWQRNDLDGSYYTDILNCRFENIGSRAIDINGGNVDTLTKSENRIENNIFTRCAQLSKNSQTIMISGVGITVKNNNISDLPFHAINIWGNDHTITHNEIYDVIQESDDCGAIYAGRNTLHRGNEIAYNYIHDVEPVKPLVYNFQGAIYLDDSLGGMDIHDNIIKDANVDLIVNGGVDFEFSDNIIMNINTYHMRVINGGIAQNHNNGGPVWAGYIANEPLYYSRYKNLQELITMGKINAKDERMAKFTKITGNLGVNNAETSVGTNTMKYGTVKNNIQIDECNDFVNPEKQDFRIKKDSETYKQNSNLMSEDFDIEQIGIQGEIENITGNFEHISPKNGEEAVNSSSVDFKWQDAKGANCYRLVIATDKELKNVVYDENTYYNVTSVEGLKNNTVYYWKVWAKNISREFGAEWESKSPVYSFCTSMYEVTDTEHLTDVADKTEQKLETIDVGENPGQYSKETVDNVRNIIRLSKAMTSARLGMIGQKNIDSMANILSGSLNVLGITNKGYIDLGEYFTNPDSWSKPVEITENNEVKISKEIIGGNNIGIDGISHMAGSVLYSFDAKLDIESAYTIFGINKDNNIAPYSAANTGYSFLFKSDIAELHVCSGTTQTIVKTVEHSIANDGNFHNIQMGFVKTDIGNLVLLYVDGEPLIEYFDVINTAVNVAGGFMVHIANDKNNPILRKSEKLANTEEFNKILEESLYKAAQTIIDGYDVDGVIAIDGNCQKAFTPKGVFNIEGTENINSKLYMKAEVIDKVFGTNTIINGNSATVSDGEKKAVLTLSENGLISLEELMQKLGKGCTYSEEQNFLIVGDIIFMNNLKVMTKTRQLMDIMTTLEEREDYIFNVAD